MPETCGGCYGRLAALAARQAGEPGGRSRLQAQFASVSRASCASCVVSSLVMLTFLLSSSNHLPHPHPLTGLLLCQLSTCALLLTLRPPNSVSRVLTCQGRSRCARSNAVIAGETSNQRC